ncbi:hypothetical protein CQW23_01303 [Capsicum baccatum]|uniref:Retrotransposon gag domain-containing protein n=1 Tax=Capsicum baccatum TaxID=33114 RepID=A0A2G2XN88_CAPBA|nr:hypothetical protein CQW23_01303 [Capsicum baccatum]
MTVLHLNGMAEVWYISFHLSEGRLKWGEFAEDICRRILDSIHSTLNLLGEFKQLEQRGTIDEYLEKFGNLKAWVLMKNPTIPEEFFLGFSLKGSRKCSFVLQRLGSCFAIIQEDIYQILMLLVALNLMQKLFCGIGAWIAVHGMEFIVMKRQDISNILPKFGGMSDLTHLDLWGLSFIGQIPSEISHLSKLNVLRIWSEDPYMITFGPHNFELLLRNLTQLRYLEIYDVNISSTIP